MNKLVIDHVFITRFNVPTPGREGLIRAQEGWLKDRVALFERFCAPSMESQTLQAFHWLVYVDPESPQWFLDWLEDGKRDRRFTAVFRSSVSRDELVSDLRQVTGGRGDVLLTTNLDNDDGLAIDFVARLHAMVASSDRTALYLTGGIILRGARTYLRTDQRNAFCSVAESWSHPVTAWADWHNRLELSMPVKELAGEPAWLQVIHERNVSNTVHGRLTKPSSYAGLFPFALQSLSDPPTALMVRENGVLRPLRGTRAGIRAGTKWLLLKSLGRDRFDGVKNHAAQMRRGLRSTIAPAVRQRGAQVRIGAED